MNNNINQNQSYLNFINNFDINNFKISNLELDKILTYHYDAVQYVQLLKNGNIISCSIDYLIKIFNPFTYQIENTIKYAKNPIAYIQQLKNGKITFSSYKSIFILNSNSYDIFQFIEIAHNGTIYKIKELYNLNLISISQDGFIKIWELKNNKYEVINEIQENGPINDVLEFKENIIIFDNNREKKIAIYDLNLNQKIKTFSNESYFNYALFNFIKLNNNNILYSSNYVMVTIDINTYEIKNESIIFGINSTIFKLCDNNFLIGNRSGDCKQIKYDEKKNDMKLISEKNNIHDESVYCFIVLKNKRIVSCSFDGTIKIWKEK